MKGFDRIFTIAYYLTSLPAFVALGVGIVERNDTLAVWSFLTAAGQLQAAFWWGELMAELRSHEGTLDLLTDLQSPENPQRREAGGVPAGDGPGSGCGSSRNEYPYARQST